MRHHIKFDGLQVLDAGNAVPVIQIDHEKFGTPPVLSGSVIDFLVQNYAKMRDLALDLILQQHCQRFPYEDGDEARNRLETLLCDRCPVPADGQSGDSELWRYGDALRLELVIKSAEIKSMERSPRPLLEFATTEMIRNAFRRLHAHELPLAEYFFTVFIQADQPTQIPLDVLYQHAVGHTRPTPAEAAAIMQENAAFWKAELQSLGNSYLQAVITDPKLLVLQNAAMYQRLKQFFNEEEK
jgi:hypothetical protein